jgi:hypothetical protein
MNGRDFDSGLAVREVAAVLRRVATLTKEAAVTPRCELIVLASPE